MKSKTLVLALALVAVALVCAAGLLDYRPSAALLFGALFAFAGTVTYAYPVAGATAPTAVESSHQSVVTARVVMGDTDTTQAVVHHFQLSTAQLAALFPFVHLRLEAIGATPNTVLVTVTDSDTVTISKASLTGSAFTGVVVIQRPHSILAQKP